MMYIPYLGTAAALDGAHTGGHGGLRQRGALRVPHTLRLGAGEHAGAFSQWTNRTQGAWVYDITSFYGSSCANNGK
eukprot:6699895-Pyramimonas_sp.AAC.2